MKLKIRTQLFGIVTQLSDKMKIALVCSHGGHLNEILYLMPAFEGHNIFFVTYDSETTKNLKNSYLLNWYGWNFKGKLMEIITIFHAFKILMKEKPDVIVSDGGGEIAVPFCYVGKILGVKIIFIESFAKITTPTAAGKFIYPIADLFLVQWEMLLKKYGKKAKYWGSII